MTVKLQLDENPILLDKIKDHYHNERYPNSKPWIDANYYFNMERWFLKTYDFRLVLVKARFMSDGNYLQDVKTPYIEFENNEQLLEFKLKML